MLSMYIATSEDKEIVTIWNATMFVVNYLLLPLLMETVKIREHGMNTKEDILF